MAGRSGERQDAPAPGPEPVAPGSEAALRAQYSEPFGWWGYHWTPPEPRSLTWLIEHGVLDERIAAFLSLAVESRASLLVVAEPHEAGKTTLLTALLDFLPPSVAPIYLRGWYERFTFLDVIPAEHAYVLCNEISAHLPTYLWGRGVRRVFEAAAAGYPLATTMHATSARDAFEQLSAYPLEVPAQHLRSIDLVVTIGVGYASNRLLRRVTSVEAVRPGDDGPLIETLATREPLRSDLDHRLGRLVDVLARWRGCSDETAAGLLARRERVLQQWLARGMTAPADVRAAISALW